MPCPAAFPPPLHRVPLPTRSLLRLAMSSTQAAPPTVIAQKQSFLATQTRLLSQPIQPSRTWLAANDSSESPLSDALIEHVVARLNHNIAQHSRRAYPHQASRHVAEQIDSLYLSHPTTVQEDEPSDGLSLSLDLSRPRPPPIVYAPLHIPAGT